jgi:D-alanine-D-alanine ligase
VDVKRDWRRRVRYHVPPRVAAATETTLQQLALTAYRLLGCRDVARIDFRLDAAGAPHFIECNPLPGLDPDNSDLVILSARRRTYGALVQGILLDATARMSVRIG